MIIITGCARSYTSLTMRLLEVLGIPVAGEKYVNKEILGKYNPDGLYEVENVVVNGLKTDKYMFNAIKLVLGALYPNTVNNQQGTSKSLLIKSNTLLCLRKPIEIAHSATKLMFKVPLSPSYPYYELSGFLGWLRYNEWFLNRLYTLDTDGYFNNTSETIEGLASFVGVYDKDRIEKAKECVRPKKPCDGLQWPEKFKRVGAFVDSLYECLIRNDFEEAIRLNEDRIKTLTSMS